VRDLPVHLSRRARMLLLKRACVRLSVLRSYADWLFADFNKSTVRMQCRRVLLDMLVFL
jgi:hypothetical protein